MNSYPPLVWGIVVVLFVLVLWGVAGVFSVLWRAWRTPEPEPQPPLYDWAKTGALEAWDKDAEGEVLSVIPASWYLRAEDAR